MKISLDLKSNFGIIQNIIRVFKEQLDLPVLRLFKLVISGLDRNQFENE